MSGDKQSGFKYNSSQVNSGFQRRSVVIPDKTIAVGQQDHNAARGRQDKPFLRPRQYHTPEKGPVATPEMEIMLGRTHFRYYLLREDMSIVLLPNCGPVQWKGSHAHEWSQGRPWAKAHKARALGAQIPI
ncbi:hypothetical protein YC2023_025774 [Brassica napus]